MQKLSLPLSIQHTVPVICISLLSVVAWAYHNSLIDMFEFNRAGLAQFELWRLVTAHFFHTNTHHLLLNLAGVTLLWALHGEKYSFSTLSYLFLFVSTSISVGIYLFTPELLRYVGLSGVLHGMFIWGACDDIRLGYKTGYAMLIGALVKIGNEQWQGPNIELGKAINATVAIDAHLYGVIAGFVAYLVTYLVHYRVPSNNA